MRVALILICALPAIAGCGEEPSSESARSGSDSTSAAATGGGPGAESPGSGSGSGSGSGAAGPGAGKGGGAADGESSTGGGGAPAGKAGPGRNEGKGGSDGDAGSTGGSGRPGGSAGSAGATGPILTSKAKPKLKAPRTDPPGKLVVVDIESGDGPIAERGDEVGVLYVGVVYATGKEFDSTWKRNELLNFELGDGSTVTGFERGIEGMRVGGRRKLIVPPRLAYGVAGIPPGIPPRSTLVFVVDLLEAR